MSRWLLFLGFKLRPHKKRYIFIVNSHTIMCELTVYITTGTATSHSYRILADVAITGTVANPCISL